jgi:hypothetical protein
MPQQQQKQKQQQSSSSSSSSAAGKKQHYAELPASGGQGRPLRGDAAAAGPQLH